MLQNEAFPAPATYFVDMYPLTTAGGVSSNPLHQLREREINNKINKPVVFPAPTPEVMNWYDSQPGRKIGLVRRISFSDAANGGRIVLVVYTWTIKTVRPLYSVVKGKVRVSHGHTAAVWGRSSTDTWWPH